MRSMVGLSKRSVLKTQLPCKLVTNLPVVGFEVEARGMHVGDTLSHAQPGEFQFAHRGVLEGKHDLHQRVVVEIACRLQFLDKPFEGQVLVVVG